MTTTTSTTSTSASVISSATQQLLTSLGSGSGVDTASLVTNLVAAEFAAKSDALTTKATTLTTQISDVANLKSTISQFASAVDSLTKSGALVAQPTSSDTSVLTATAKSGAKVGNLSRSIVVTSLAAAQTARTTNPVSRTATGFTGTLTLSVGTNSASSGVSVSDSAAATLSFSGSTIDQVASAINGANKGVTATVVTDSTGNAYLSLRGSTGANQAFSLTSSDDSLQDLVVGGTSTSTKPPAVDASASDAQLTVDGVPVTRSSNTVSDLVDGVTLTLLKPSTTAVSLTTTTPTSDLSTAVSNFVTTYNQVYATVTAATNLTTGSLAHDSAAQNLLRQLKSLASKVLLTGSNVTTGGPTRLSDLGVGTNRDGTLKLDTAVLTKQITAFPDAVEAMFGDPTNNTNGIATVLDTVSTAAASTIYGLGASTARYTAAQTVNADAQTAISTAKDKETTRLTQQFSSMNSKVASYKSTQTFLTNQIAAWNKSDS